jgi:predicted nicotinamide N-methyase
VHDLLVVHPEVVEGREVLELAVGALDDYQHLLAVGLPHLEGQLDPAHALAVEVLVGVVGVLDAVHHVVPVVLTQVLQVVKLKWGRRTYQKR